MHKMFVTASKLASAMGLDAGKPRAAMLRELRTAMPAQMPVGGANEWSRARGLKLEDLTHAVACAILGVDPPLHQTVVLRIGFEVRV